MLENLIGRVRGALTPDTEADLRSQIAAVDARIAELADITNNQGRLGPLLQQRSDLDVKLSNYLHAKLVSDATAADEARRNGADKNLKAALKTASTMRAALAKAQTAAAAARTATDTTAAAVAAAEDAHHRATFVVADALLTPDAADDGAAQTAAAEAMGRMQSARDVHAVVVQRAAQADAAVGAATAALASAQRETTQAARDVAEARLHAAREAFKPHVALWFAASREFGVFPGDITFGEDGETAPAAQAELRAMLGEG